MKKITSALTLTMVFALASVCSASPLTDYSNGKASIDLTLRSGGDINVSSGGSSGKIDARDSNFEGTVTYGLGNNFAVQYRNTTGDSKDYNFSGNIYGYNVNASGKTTSKAQEFNVLYKLDKNVSAFVGWTQAKAGIDVTGRINGQAGSASIDGDNKNGYQVGLVGTTTLGSGFTGFASVAAGNHITNYELGVGYEVAKNVELNVGYKDTKYKGLTLSYAGYTTPKYDYEIKGMTYGLTYKF